MKFCTEKHMTGISRYWTTVDVC